MMRTVVRGFLAAALATALASGVPAADASPTPAATAMLFDAKHLTSIPKGGEAVYRFERKVSDPKLLGEAFTDKISIGLEYLYVNMGGNDFNANLTGGPFSSAAPSTNATGSDEDFDFGTLQLRVSYRF